MDKIITAGCIMLFVTGFIFGAASGVDATGGGRLKASLELASFVATISACCVAVYSLNLWRKQFKHSKEFEVLSATHKAVNRLKIFARYATTFMHLQITSKKGFSQQEYYQGIFEEIAFEWEQSHLDVVDCLSELGVISDEEFALRLAVHRERLYEIISMVTFYIVESLHEDDRDVQAVVHETNKQIKEAGVEFRELQATLMARRKLNVGGHQI